MKELFSDKITVAGLTHSGMKRDHNEDSFGVEKDLKLLFVADGMGGHQAGEVASALAVEAISDFVYECDFDLIEEKRYVTPEVLNITDGDVKRSMSVVASAVSNANKRICDENIERGMKEGRGMGTTIVGLWLLEQKKKAIVFHVGDSRCYLFRDGKLKATTIDHSLYHEWLKQGGEGKPPGSNIILKALGPYREVVPELNVVDLKENDVFLLCSDGLNDMVSDEVIERELGAVDSENLEAVCKNLVNRANNNGGKDNITVLIAHIK